MVVLFGLVGCSKNILPRLKFPGRVELDQAWPNHRSSLADCFGNGLGPIPLQLERKSNIAPLGVIPRIQRCQSKNFTILAVDSGPRGITKNRYASHL